MDWITLRQKAGKHLGNYKQALLILAVGLFLMSFPQDKPDQAEPDTPAATVQEETLEARLAAILSQIQGVGEVRVLLTESKGPESIFQTDESGTSKDTVIISDADRTESGLVKQRVSPVYQGAIVVCQGGADASIRLCVMEAVSNVTGISTSRITVLKMN